MGSNKLKESAKNERTPAMTDEETVGRIKQRLFASYS